MKWLQDCPVLHGQIEGHVPMIALLIAFPWVLLIFAWGGFWRADQKLPKIAPLQIYPAIDIIIPARDEADVIQPVVEAHLRTGYPGKIRLLVVDDDSSDNTGALALAAGATVIKAPTRPQDWSGKLWALHTGLSFLAKDSRSARWTLLTDADIVHAPNTLQLLVEKAETGKHDLVSLMARLDTNGFWGRLLIPAFIFFFQKLYPFPWVNRSGHRCSAAAGGCILIRTTALEDAGGIESIRGALIDDCALAARIKAGASNGSIWLGLASEEVVSLRDNSSFRSNWAMVKRTAFSQLRHSYFLLIGTVIGMVWVYILPVLAIPSGILMGETAVAISGALAIGMMCIAYRPTLRLYGLAWWRTLSLPLAATVYAAMTVGSAVDHYRGKGGLWKGRIYSGRT